MNRVTTTSTCGRCRATEVREGDWGASCPKGWAAIILQRLETYLARDMLCSPCQDAVLAVLKPECKPWCPTEKPNGAYEKCNCQAEDAFVRCTHCGSLNSRTALVCDDCNRPTELE